MNDFLARELIDVLKHMAASQRMVERHLAVIRLNFVVLAMRDDLNKLEEIDVVWDDERANIAVQREEEGIEDDID
jgi:hypothetical protein